MNVDGEVGSLAGGGLMQWPLLLDWLGHHLKGQPLKLLRKGEVRLLAPGDNRWRTLSSWPSTAATTATSTTFAPSSISVAEAGVLPMPSTSTALGWQHDPRDPVQSHGGASLLAFSFFPEQGVIPGPVEQGPPLSMKRGITMRSAVLANELFISGAAQLTLTVTSTAPDTAVVARLIVEGQSRPGDALLVREAAATLSFPTSENRAVTMAAPGTPVTLTFDFWPVAWRVPKGARIRLDLTSSSFPALANHTNHLAPWAAQTDADFGTVADIALVDDGSARLTLPLWSASAATAP
jgi:putative CocE/NonD family hydrolase